MVRMQYCLKLGLDPPASSLPEPLNSNRWVEYHAVKRVVNSLEPENGPEAEPNANLDAAEQGAGPNAEWTLCERQNVVPDADYAAETRETQLRKTSLVSALMLEALSDDDDNDEIMPLEGHRTSNEAETMKGVVYANDIPAGVADEPHLEQEHDFQPSQLFQDLEADSSARSDESFLDRNCTTPVRDTLKDRQDIAIDSSLEDTRGSILAVESGSGFGLMDNDRHKNDVIDLNLLQDRHYTGLGVESETDPLLDGALKSLQGENEFNPNRYPYHPNSVEQLSTYMACGRSWIFRLGEFPVTRLEGYSPLLDYLRRHRSSLDCCRHLPRFRYCRHLRFTAARRYLPSRMVVAAAVLNAFE